MTESIHDLFEILLDSIYILQLTPWVNALAAATYAPYLLAWE